MHLALELPGEMYISSRLFCIIVNNIERCFSKRNKLAGVRSSIGKIFNQRIFQ